MLTYVLLAVGVMLVVAVIAAAGGFRGRRTTVVDRPVRRAAVVDEVVERPVRPAPVTEEVVERRVRE